MRNFEERKAEVFRRSEKRIKERIRKRNSLLAVGIPMCLVFIVLSITSFRVKEAETIPGVGEEVTDGDTYGEVTIIDLHEKDEVDDSLYEILDASSTTGNAYIGGMYEDGGNDKDTASPEGAAGYEENSVNFISRYIRTDGYDKDAKYPDVKIIRSVGELHEYYSANKDKYNLERKDEVYSDTTIGFLDACDKYDEKYFENQILVMVLLEEGSGSVRHNVESVKVAQDDKLYISICAIVPEVGTCDMAEWHILIEPETGIDVVNEADVIVSVYAEYQ